MKYLAAFLLSFTVFAQAANRPVVLTWTASTSTGVVGYNISRATSPTGPFTLLNTSPVVGTTYTDSAVIGQTYTYQLVAVGPACTPTTPVTQPCGVSTPISATTTVPPNTSSVVTFAVLVQ